MAKKKAKKENQQFVVEKPADTKNKKRTENDIIQDTTAPPLLLDVTAKDDEKTIEGLLDLERSQRRNDMTVSFRIPEEEYDWMKEISRRIAIKEKKDVNYQKLLRSVFLERYPMEGKDENKRSKR